MTTTTDGRPSQYSGGDDYMPDPQRINFLGQHLATLLRAIDAGVPVRGYVCWSLLDHFETLQRISKDSGYWYGHVTRTNAPVE